MRWSSAGGGGACDRGGGAGDGGRDDAVGADGGGDADGNGGDADGNGGDGMFLNEFGGSNPWTGRFLFDLYFSNSSSNFFLKI